MRDREGVVFGTFATEIRPASLPPTFYGGGESFVFQVESIHNLPPLPQEDSPPPTEARARPSPHPHPRPPRPLTHALLLHTAITRACIPALDRSVTRAPAFRVAMFTDCS